MNLEIYQRALDEIEAYLSSFKEKYVNTKQWTTPVQMKEGVTSIYRQLKTYLKGQFDTLHEQIPIKTKNQPCPDSISSSGVIPNELPETNNLPDFDEIDLTQKVKKEGKSFTATKNYIANKIKASKEQPDLMCNSDTTSQGEDNKPNEEISQDERSRQKQKILQYYPQHIPDDYQKKRGDYSEVSREFFLTKYKKRGAEITEVQKYDIRKYLRENFRDRSRNKVQICKEIQKEYDLKFREVYDFVTLILNEIFKVPIRRYKRHQFNQLGSDSDSEKEKNPQSSLKQANISQDSQEEPSSEGSSGESDALIQKYKKTTKKTKIE